MLKYYISTKVETIVRKTYSYVFFGVSDHGSVLEKTVNICSEKNCAVIPCRTHSTFKINLNHFIKFNWPETKFIVPHFQRNILGGGPVEFWSVRGSY